MKVLQTYIGTVNYCYRRQSRQQNHHQLHYCSKIRVGVIVYVLIIDFEVAKTGMTSFRFVNVLVGLKVPNEVTKEQLEGDVEIQVKSNSGIELSVVTVEVDGPVPNFSNQSNPGTKRT